MRIHGLQWLRKKMTKRRSKALGFFCSPDEFESILEHVLVKYGLQLCEAEKRQGKWFFREIEPSGQTHGRLPQFYVFDTMMARGGLDSLANIVQVWLPKSMDGGICMGEIATLITDSELDRKMVKLQSDVYRDLHKALSSKLQRGVWGRNSKTGGEHFYKDILISNEINTASRNGLVLRTTLGDGFVTFSPERTQ